MNDTVAGAAAPQSLGLADLTRDVAPFVFLAQARAQGIAGALVTVSGVDGGAPKPVGTHLAVLADGRHVGHVSGGCVEPAIAAEVAPLIAGGVDQIIRFGKGSCFMDIRFPCGGGVDLLVHVAPTDVLLEGAVSRLNARVPFSIVFEPKTSRATILDDAARPTGWDEESLVRRYLPRTRLLAAGRGPELEVMARVAFAAEFDVTLATSDDDTAASLRDLQAAIRLKSPSSPFAASIDAWTATVVLFHEHEWEDSILAYAAGSPAFYIGALGSQRTHAARLERLASKGLTAAQLARIRGPIGLVARARDPGTLALSILAEISSVRAQVDAK